MGHLSIWAYGLAPDVTLTETGEIVLLNSPVGSISLSETAHATLARELAMGCLSEVELAACIAPAQDAQDICASLLFRLDRLGYLKRFLMQGAKPIAACVPRRAPTNGFPECAPKDNLQLSPRAMLRPNTQGFTAQIPGSWASIDLYDASLGPLLFALSRGAGAKEAKSCTPRLEPEVFDALVRLFDWCDLLDGTADHSAPLHEALFHNRTRKGFARARLGKIRDSTPAQEPDIVTGFALPLPDRAGLLAHDAPYMKVSQHRRSLREQGSKPISYTQLSELLFRCFYQENGRRSYPSGGGLYSLTAHLIVNRCDGLAPGLYTYEAVHHRLSITTEITRSLEYLLDDAAAAANCVSRTQILLVLSANMSTVRRAYGDLAYSLVLKEVGAVYQSVQLAGTAMKLATCPLGTGNSMIFAKVSGLDLRDEPSVGEIMIGSLD